MDSFSLEFADKGEVLHEDATRLIKLESVFLKTLFFYSADRIRQPKVYEALGRRFQVDKGCRE
jgi:hypothetical protein